MSSSSAPGRRRAARGCPTQRTSRAPLSSVAARRELAVIVVFAIAVGLVPAYASEGTVALFTSGLLFVAFCFAWNLVGGFLGELALVHVVFWGLGAYGFVLAGNHGLPAVPALIVLVVVGAIAGVCASALIAAARLEGLLYVAIFTLVLSEIIVAVVSNSGGLGGSEGVISTATTVIDGTVLYVLLVLLVLVAGLINVAVARSSVGLRWLAVRDDPVAAAAVGVTVSRVRLVAYAVSAMLCVLGGAYQAYYAGYARPDVSLSTSTLVLVLVAVFVGGAGTALGPLVGAIIINGLGDIVQELSTSVSVALYAQIVEFGVAMLVLRFVLPRVPHKDLLSAAAGWARRWLVSRRSRAAGAGDDDRPTRPVAASALSDVERLLGGEREHSAADGHDDWSVLALRGVTKRFGTVVALADVSLTLDRGKVTGIVGANGAGKSTLCNIISGIESMSSGSIALDGMEIGRLGASKRAELGFGRAFQAPRLFASLSLVDNLVLRPEMSRDDAVEIATTLGIAAPETKFGEEADFFARRLVEVTRAASAGRNVLLLDEPLAGLTPAQREFVLAMARRSASQGACVVIVEHLVPVLAPAVDRLVVLDRGSVIAAGDPATVLRSEAVVDAYLGAPMEIEVAL